MVGLLKVFLLLSLGLFVLVGDTEGGSLTPLPDDFGLFFVVDVGGWLGGGVCGGGEAGHIWEGGTHYTCRVLWFCMWSASCLRAGWGLIMPNLVMIQCRKRPLEFAGGIIASVSGIEKVGEGGGIGGVEEVAEGLLFSLEEVEVLISGTGSSVDGGVELFDRGEVGCHGCLSCLHPGKLVFARRRNRGHWTHAGSCE